MNSFASALKGAMSAQVVANPEMMTLRELIRVLHQSPEKAKRVWAKIQAELVSKDPYISGLRGKIIAVEGLDVPPHDKMEYSTLFADDTHYVHISECAPREITREESNHDVTFYTAKYRCSGVIWVRIKVTCPLGQYNTMFGQTFLVTDEMMSQIRSLIIQQLAAE